MKSSANLQSAHENTQIKVFTRWCNLHFAEKALQIHNLATDFSDGIMLIKLLEILTNKPIKIPSKRPKIGVQKAENCSKALRIISKHQYLDHHNSVRQISLSNISSRDIVDCKTNLIIRLLSIILLHIQLGQYGPSVTKNGLLLWCQKHTENYENVKIKNFHKSWNSGNAFSALIHRFRPDILVYNPHLSQKEQLEAAFAAATKCGIVNLVDIEDLLIRPDEKSIFTQVLHYFLVFSTIKPVNKTVENIDVATTNNSFPVEEYLKKIQLLEHQNSSLLSQINALSPRILEEEKPEQKPIETQSQNSFDVELSPKYVALQTLLSQSQAKASEHEKIAIDSQSQLNEIRADFTLLQEKLSSTLHKLSISENLLVQTNTNVQSLQNSLDTVRTKLQNAESINSEKDSQILSLKNEISDISKQLQLKTDEICDINSKIDSLSKSFNQEQRINSNLKNTIKERDKQLLASKSLLDSALLDISLQSENSKKNSSFTEEQFDQISQFALKTLEKEEALLSRFVHICQILEPSESNDSDCLRCTNVVKVLSSLEGIPVKSLNCDQDMI